MVYYAHDTHTRNRHRKLVPYSLTYCFLHKSCLKTSKRQTIMVGVGLLCNNHHSNKCIGDDTKAAARQSLNCIKNQKNKIWRRTIINMAHGILTPCNVACGSGIVSVNSPSGSTLQCDMWLWDDMPLNSPKRPSYWNSTSGFAYDHITTVDVSFCTSLLNFIQIGPPSAEKHDVMSIFKMADLSHFGF